VEAKIRAQRRERQVWRYNEAGIDQSKTPIQDAYHDLNRGGYKREVVLGGEKVVRYGLRR
jgi:hypothetical protein